MSISVQTSNAALLALQTLNRLNDPSSADGAASSSAAASSASSASTSSTTDPSSAAVIASGVQGLGGDTLGAVSASLDRAASITDAALAAGQSVSDLLSQMQALAGSVQTGSASGDPSTDLSSLLQQLAQAVSSGEFDGVNLLDGSASGNSSVLASGGPGGSVTLSAQDLSLGGPVITLGSTASLSTQTAASAVLSQVDASIANLGGALGQIADQARQIQAHSSFVSRLGEALAAGGTDASASQSLSSDGAKLMALQVQQQLSLQGGPIASAQPAVVLSLFK